jgi:aspartate ammonia-lyase
MRIERDAMGEMEIPDSCYYGVQTMRAIANFAISGIKPLPNYVSACVLIKKAAALVNAELGCIPVDVGMAIACACENSRRQTAGSICRRCLSGRSGDIAPHECQ